MPDARRAAELDSLFAADGLLAREIDGYRPRAAQIDMAHAVAAAMQATAQTQPEPAMFETNARPARRQAVGGSGNGAGNGSGSGSNGAGSGSVGGNGSGDGADNSSGGRSGMDNSASANRSNIASRDDSNGNAPHSASSARPDRDGASASNPSHTDQPVSSSAIQRDAAAAQTGIRHETARHEPIRQPNATGGAFASQNTSASATPTDPVSDNTLIVEAGTGTGKTFAYLVPAMLWGGKVIVSTGTKHLQDQLFQRDIPTVRDALAVPVSVAMLKGRANYLCHYYLQRTADSGRLPSRQESAHLQEIVRFAKITRSGDKAELASVPETAAVWSLVTSTRENCLGQECPHYKDCFVMQARKQAQQADIVVVNHHLFFADIMLRDTGMAELLPSANTIIFDEAHQLPETATLFFGETLSTLQFLELARDCVAEGLSHARDAVEWVALGGALERAARDVRLAFREDALRLSITQLPTDHPVFSALDALQTALDALATALAAQAERAESLGACLRRARELRAHLAGWTVPSAGDQAMPSVTGQVPGSTSPSAHSAHSSLPLHLPATATSQNEARHDARNTAARAHDSLPPDISGASAAHAAHIARTAYMTSPPRADEPGARHASGAPDAPGVSSAPDASEKVRWVEVFSQTVQLHETPLSVAPIFAKQREGAPRTWIFTSATLSVRGDFTHYAAQMGLNAQRSMTLASPFDYASQGLLYVPRNMPQPSSPRFTDAVFDAAWPVIEAAQAMGNGAGGGVFMLCTTLRAVDRIAVRLRDALSARGLTTPLLVQGDASRTELLERFRAYGNAILVGSQSFWEGVDVRGDALSLVVIDKLPFAPPDDPVLSARLDALSKKGLSPFAVHQLPQAVITLKQGAGRLIRAETDRGVLMICDTRLVEKPYGRRIWQSLPPFKRTRETAVVQAFFAGKASGGMG